MTPLRGIQREKERERESQEVKWTNVSSILTDIAKSYWPSADFGVLPPSIKSAEEIPPVLSLVYGLLARSSQRLYPTGREPREIMLGKLADENCVLQLQRSWVVVPPSDSRTPKALSSGFLSAVGIIESSGGSFGLTVLCPFEGETNLGPFVVGFVVGRFDADETSLDSLILTNNRALAAYPVAVSLLPRRIWVDSTNLGTMRALRFGNKVVDLFSDPAGGGTNNKDETWREYLLRGVEGLLSGSGGK